MSSKRNADTQPYPTTSSYNPISTDPGEPSGAGQTQQNTYNTYQPLPPPLALAPASAPTTPLTPSNPKKRRISSPSAPSSMLPPPSASSSTFPETESPTQPGAVPGAVTSAAPGAAASAPVVKKSRTNTPWTPAEEQRLKIMRDAGNSWSEIAKTFPARTEGSVKKHWYKDMHYAEFAEDESAALLAAIKEYEANKWKVIGQKLGKPAKACEQYAKEHFAGKM